MKSVNCSWARKDVPCRIVSAWARSVGTDDPGVHTSRDQGIRFPWLETEGAGWECTEAEHRKADLQELRHIPV